MKPNLFIVGSAKAGTTSLYHYLNEHPDVFMSEIKETNYFSYDEIKAQGLFYNEEHISTLKQYEDLFKNTGEAKVAGEASVSYIFYPSVAQKIKDYDADAKILIVLRNPVARAYSHYLMDKRLGFVSLSFEDILHKSKPHPKLDLYYQQYIELGFYYEQVKRYLDVFGNNAVRIFLYDDVVKNINGVVKEAYEFLNIDENFQPQTETSHNAFVQPKNKLLEKLYASKPVRRLAKSFAGGKAEALKNMLMSKEKKPQLPAALKTELQNLYRDNMLLTQNLIHKDLTSWLTN